MQIKPSAAIRQNYNTVSKLCKETREPVYLTRNGEGDLVVMDIDTFTRREKMLRLREELLASEEDVAAGVRTYSIPETRVLLEDAVARVSTRKKVRK